MAKFDVPWLSKPFQPIKTFELAMAEPPFFFYRFCVVEVESIATFFAVQT